MELKELRGKIDDIDTKLLPLFISRMECAKEVAAVKKASGGPVWNPEREDEVLAHAAQNAGEYAGEARVLYSTLMDMSRVLQHRLLGSGEPLRALTQNSLAPPRSENVAVFGQPGTFTRAAAELFFPSCAPMPFESFAEIFAAVRSGAADLGVLPVENSSAGSVSEVYSLILQYRFYIVGARTLEINQCLAANCAEEKLARVYSHPQGLAQCSDFIAKCGIEAVSCATTAEGARLASQEPNAGAICSARAAQENGLRILRQDVQNTKNNRTRFIVISRAPYLPLSANKISLCFALPHRTGTLYSVLARFAAAGLNLTKIESRPISGENFEYDFYLDFTGSLHDSATLTLIAALQTELPRFSLLGNYTEDE